MKRTLTLLLLQISFLSHSQPNCMVYKTENNSACYEACLMATDAENSQGSRYSQEKFDEAVAKCPTLDYAYREKSVPYLKRGDFITWKKLIDKAVSLNPRGHLGYRGWCRYQFLRDYKGAIADFEKLDSMTQFDIGYSQNGDYQLNIVKALCYKALGKKQQAIQIIEKQLTEKGYSPFPFDYLHLGVIKLEINDLEGATEALKKSIQSNDYFAENYYYLSIVYKKKNDKELSKSTMLKAKEFYLKGYKRFDPYTQPMDKIYLAEIEKELL